MAPKGTRLASGYQDRTQQRTSAVEDEKASRVKALEDMVKLGQMERATFEALRDEIVGGEVKDVHLVKGLDYKLLERVRRGEDVLAKTEEFQQPLEGSEKEQVDVEAEFERLEEKDIQPTSKSERVKKGDMAPPPIACKKRTRDDILQELKASRLAAAEANRPQQPTLGPKFTKFGERKEKSRIEKDEKGREVLITVDEDGNVKRRVRKPKNSDPENPSHALLMPDKATQPLGMEVADLIPPPEAEAEDEGDIFEDAGKDYDPLAGMEEADSDSDVDAKIKTKPPTSKDPPLANLEDSATLNSESPTSSPPLTKNHTMLPPPLPREAPTNYFATTISPPSSSTSTTPTLSNDPTILAALRKASTLHLPNTPSSATEAAKLARHTAMLSSHDRDAEDMDLGFGSSRFGDQEDGEGEGKRVKLSVWGEEGKGDEEEGVKGKRKRGKKRKGDGENVKDVLAVMERRKGEGK